MNRTCKHCGSTAIIMLTSQNLKLCADCKLYTPNPLRPGQQSILENKTGDNRLLAKSSNQTESGH